MTPSAHAQGQPQLVPIVTDQTPLPLSNHFGVAGPAALDQSGDYMFRGEDSASLFSRPAGAAALAYVFQRGDEVPGFSGSLADLIQGARINSAGLIAFEVDFDMLNGVPQGIIFTYNGTSLKEVIDGTQNAPGGGGANFERLLSLVGLNDSGDVAFTAPLVISGSGLPNNTTLYIAPGGGTPVRVAGLGDCAPGTGGTFGSLSPLGFNNRGEELFRANITGGAGGSGLFVGSISGVRKIVSNGDPNPLGGTFSSPVGGLLNNVGQVAFTSLGAPEQTIWINSIATGNSPGASQNDPAPASLAGTTIGPPSLQALDDSGDISFLAIVRGSSLTNLGLFRLVPGNPIGVIAYNNEPATGAAGEVFNGFSAVSINTTGVVSFRAALGGGPTGFGIFQQAGVNPPVNIALDGQVTALAGGGVYSLSESTPTQTLNNGSVYFFSDILGGAAYYAEFLIANGNTTVLMNTADSLPTGARFFGRTFAPSAGTDNVGFFAFYSGGRISIMVHNITSQANTLIATEGDPAPGTGGGIIGSVNSINTVFMNSSGTIAFSAQIIGGTINGNPAIFVGVPGSGLFKVVATGDMDSVTGRTFSGPQLNGVTPSSINDAGQVVFSSALESGLSSIRGVYVGSAGVSPSKVAVTGDTTADGSIITSFPVISGGESLWINSAGQVAVIATTAGGIAGVEGIFVGSPGGTLTKVVAAGDPGPGGSTFSGFAVPGFNNGGQVAFIATLNGGPGGGVFIGSTSAVPVVLASNGDPAPAGGNFSITAALPDAQINDEQDVVFRANLTGGTADSGYFVRRGPLGTLQAPVLQGQAAPGAPQGDSFNTINTNLNGLLGGSVQLDPSGNIAFQNAYVSGNQLPRGAWHIKTDNTIEQILVRGIVAPEFGGGTAVENTIGVSWNSGARFPLWAGVSGGTFTDGIFLFVPGVATNTPAGTSVPITPTDATTNTSPVTMTFDSVTQAGTTSLTTSAGGPAIPNAFSLGNPPAFFNLSTTAVFTGSITVCINFSAISFPNGSNLRLLHFDGTEWVDVTTSGPTNNVICGSVTSLSPFTVARVSAGFEFNALISGISGISGTPPGTVKSLLAKAQAAQDSFNAGDNKTAQNQLNALINELEAQSGKHLSASEAALLINVATDIINALNH